MFSGTYLCVTEGNGGCEGRLSRVWVVHKPQVPDTFKIPLNFHSLKGTLNSIFLKQGVILLKVKCQSMTKKAEAA